MPVSYDVTVKVCPAQWTAASREVIPSYQTVGALCGKVAASLGPSMNQSQFPFAIWHDAEYKPTDVDAEAGFYLNQEVPAPTGVVVLQEPETIVASTVHNGAYRRLPEAYKAVLDWISANAYKVAGPFRELYLQVTSPVSQDDESCITEIQVPVDRT